MFVYNSLNPYPDQEKWRQKCTYPIHVALNNDRNITEKNNGRNVTENYLVHFLGLCVRKHIKWMALQIECDSEILCAKKIFDFRWIPKLLAKMGSSRGRWWEIYSQLVSQLSMKFQQCFPGPHLSPSASTRICCHGCLLLPPLGQEGPLGGPALHQESLSEEPQVIWKWMGNRTASWRGGGKRDKYLKLIRLRVIVGCILSELVPRILSSMMSVQLDRITKVVGSQVMYSFIVK